MKKRKVCGWDPDRRQDCRDWRPWDKRLVGGFDCGCTTRCLYPCKKHVAERAKKGWATVVIGRKVYVIQ